MLRYFISSREWTSGAALSCLRLALILPIHTRNRRCRAQIRSVFEKRKQKKSSDRGRGSTPHMEDPLDGRGCVLVTRVFFIDTHRSHFSEETTGREEKRIGNGNGKGKEKKTDTFCSTTANASVHEEEFERDIVGGTRWSGFTTPRPVGRSTRHRLFYVHRCVHLDACLGQSSIASESRLHPQRGRGKTGNCGRHSRKKISL
jgi:hypothetical protein